MSFSHTSCTERVCSVKYMIPRCVPWGSNSTGVKRSRSYSGTATYVVPVTAWCTLPTEQGVCRGRLTLMYATTPYNARSRLEILIPLGKVKGRVYTTGPGTKTFPISHIRCLDQYTPSRGRHGRFAGHAARGNHKRGLYIARRNEWNIVTNL